jgi:ATP-dependent DNA ligase
MTSTSVTIKDYRTLPGVISETKYYYRFPTLSYETKKGSKVDWQVYVGLLQRKDNGKYRTMEILDEYFNNKTMDESIIAVIKTDSGVVGGKVRDTDDTYVMEGKNIGRSNETNVFCQALRDAYSKYRKHADKTNPGDKVPPMLAKSMNDMFDNPADDIDWSGGMFVQRKYDGNRMMSHLIADSEGNYAVECYSRNLKPLMPNPGIVEDIEVLLLAALQKPKLADPLNLYLDGEMYKHGQALQKLGSLRSKSSASVKDIKYMTFDLYDKSRPNMTFEDRLDLLQELYSRVGELSGLEEVETFRVTSHKSLMKLYHRFLDEKYEGAMIKFPNGKFEPSRNGYKSGNIMKLKKQHMEEFVVVGFEGGEGKGKAQGAIMIICDVGDNSDTRFTVTPALPLEERKNLFDRYTHDLKTFKNELKGKKIVVTFDDYSEDGVPLRARTSLEVREDV